MLKLTPTIPNATILVPGDKETTILFAAKHFIETGKKAIETHGNFFVALSGGSTPRAIFTEIALSYAESLDWSCVHLFWSDERSVPPSNDESNYKMAMDSAFASLPIPEDNIHRLKGEEELEKSAHEYEAIIQKTLGKHPFDLIMLGMGEDGHTASLFPNTSALDEKVRLVTANYVPQKETWRLTMTFPLINKAKNIVLYVLGKDKATMVAQILMKNAPHPAGQVGTNANKATWLLDDSAAAILSKKV